MQSRVTLNPSRKFIQQQLSGDQLARNSKIINRKQLQRRIQGLKEQQYANICSNLSNQNKRLKVEVKSLHEKVEQLLINKKVSKVEKNPQIEQEIIKHKRELELKYQSMNYLKEEIRKRKKLETAGDLHLQQIEFVNGLISTERQITQLGKQKKKLLQLLRVNEADMNDYNPGSNTETQARIETIRLQNKDIKNQILQLNQTIKKRQQDSKHTLGRYYELKKTQQRHIKTVNQGKTERKSNKTLQELKQSTIPDLQVLEKQIEELKKMKKNTEKYLVNEKMLKESKKVTLQKEIKDNLEHHKDLFKRRVKILHQLNMYQKKDHDYHDSIVQKVNKEPVQLADNYIQTEIFYEKEFRKDGIGNVTGPSFNDGISMNYKSQVQIRSVTLFLTKEYIVFVKFHYQVPGRYKSQTQVPFDSLVLKKCECKKLVSNSYGHLVNLKVSLSSNKITRIEFRWSDGSSSLQGLENDNSTRYQFDLEANERPVAMFGSVSHQGKTMYALESLGCQIYQPEE